jgi:hypothetical protein
MTPSHTRVRPGVESPAASLVRRFVVANGRPLGTLGAARGSTRRGGVVAVSNAGPKNTPKAAKATSEVERKLVAMAKQLGVFVGTVEAKADGWLDREVLAKEVGRIRDVATDLLAQVNRGRQMARGAATPSAAPPARPSRGPVDAPGKRHRKPPPQEPIDKRMGEPVGKKMGQKSMKNRMRSGRG